MSIELLRGKKLKDVVQKFKVNGGYYNELYEEINSDQRLYYAGYNFGELEKSGLFSDNKELRDKVLDNSLQWVKSNESYSNFDDYISKIKKTGK